MPRRLKWPLVALALVLVVVEAARLWLRPRPDVWLPHALTSAVLVAGLALFLWLVFAATSRGRCDLEQANRELAALQEATEAIHGEHELSMVLQRIVERARLLVGARYGALSVVGPDGRIEEFLVAGISAELAARLPHPPKGEGLLGIPLNEGQRLRLPDMSRHPRAAGFPPDHPPMRSLLAVPVTCSSPFRGNLYMTDKGRASARAADFTPGDEETLARFATVAAAAIDNVYLHQRFRALAVSEERSRISREMHDGMTQVVAYVNTKAQAVQEYLRAGRTEEAERQLDELARASREVYAELREGILSLRTQLDPSRSLPDALGEFLERWREQTGIDARLEVSGTPSLTPSAELQVLRIVQEALSNVRKHSEARTTTVELSRSDGTVVAAVADDGIGFDPCSLVRSERPRFGLAIMRERAQSIGAELEIRSEPGAGTRVRVTVPAVPETRAGLPAR